MINLIDLDNPLQSRRILPPGIAPASHVIAQIEQLVHTKELRCPGPMVA
jgi:hypothetical protein